MYTTLLDPEGSQIPAGPRMPFSPLALRCAVHGFLKTTPDLSTPTRKEFRSDVERRLHLPADTLDAFRDEVEACAFDLLPAFPADPLNVGHHVFLDYVPLSRWSRTAPMPALPALQAAFCAHLDASLQDLSAEADVECEEHPVSMLTSEWLRGSRKPALMGWERKTYDAVPS